MFKFYKNAKFLVIFIGLSLGSIQVFSSEKASCLELFRAIVQNNERANYQLNYDKVIKKIHELEFNYKNELKVSKAFEYDGEEVLRIDMPSRAKEPRARVIITAGVHGNESVGTATLMEVLEEIIYNHELRNSFDFVIYPTINPGGLKNNSRYLNNGKDLNRTFKKGHEQKLTNLLKESLKGEKFDLALDLHEAPTKKGFFVIKAQDGDEKYIETVMAQIDQKHVFSAPDNMYPYNVPNTKNPNLTSYVLSSPGVTASFNKGTVKSFFRDDLGATHSYTVESGGMIDLAQRKETYKKLVHSFLELY